MDPEDKETWGDSEHRLAQISETTVIHKNIVEVSNLFLGFCPVWNGYINYSSRFLFEYHMFYSMECTPYYYAMRYSLCNFEIMRYGVC